MLLSHRSKVIGDPSQTSFWLGILRFVPLDKCEGNGKILCIQKFG